MDITVKDGVYIYKLFDKGDAFPFFIVRMPYIDSNVAKSIFYSPLVDEFFRIARSSLLYKGFNEKAKRKHRGCNPSGVVENSIIQNHSKT